MYFELKDYDTSAWKEFKISSFFTFEKGYDLSPNKNDVFNTNGDNLVKCLVAKNNNCGIGGYKLNPIKTWNKDGLAIIAQGDGGAGLSYYVEAPFCANKCVWVLIPKDNIYFNKYVGLFLSSLLSKYKSMFSHSNGLNFNKVKNLSIKLPVDHNGEPDWEYMENKVKNMYSFVYTNFFNELINFKNKNINTSAWKEFKIKSLFIKKSIKKQSKTPNTKGDVPFVTSQSINNGIKTYVDKENIEIYPKNSITISTNGKCFDCFYHDYEIIASSDVEVLYNNSLNKYNALFLCSILNKESKKYNYDNKPKNGIVWETIIKLPVDHNGEPDWEYMENYVKSLPYSKYL